MTVRDLIREATGQGGFLLPRQITVYGPLDSDIPGRIDGHVEGDAKVNGKLVIGKDASIKGNVTASSLVLHGKIYGHVIVTDKAVVGNRAYIQGDIYAPVLDIDKGATIDGKIRRDAMAALIGPPLPSPTSQEGEATDINDIPPDTIIRQNKDENETWW